MTDPGGAEAGALLYLGRILRPHGLRGVMRVRIFSGHGMPGLPEGTEVLLDRTSLMKVTGCRPGSDSTLNVSFDGIRDRDDAERFRDAGVYIVRKDAAERLGFVPLYLFRGLELRSRGRSMRVLDAEPSAANPLLLVEDEGRMFHVPLSLVMHEGRLDWSKGVLELDLPEGLEDLTI